MKIIEEIPDIKIQSNLLSKLIGQMPKDFHLGLLVAEGQTITDIAVPKQTRSAAITYVDPIDLYDTIDAAQTEGRKVVGMIKYQPLEGHFLSAADIHSMQNMPSSDMNLFAVCNIVRECTVYQYREKP